MLKIFISIIMSKKKKKSNTLGRKFLNLAAPFLAKLYLKLLALTSKVEIVNQEAMIDLKEKTDGCIYAFWHGRLIYMAQLRKTIPLHKNDKVTVLISQHKDGELVARLSEKMGMEVVRGSTTRGGEAGMKALIRAIKKTGYGAVTPDGPRGPRQKAQPGTILLAKLTGYPIMPASYSWKRKKFLTSWDRFLVPLPFSKGILIYGNPIWIDKDTDNLDDYTIQLENELNRITEEADNKMAS